MSDDARNLNDLITETMQAMPRDVLLAALEHNIEWLTAVGRKGGATDLEYAGLLMRAACRFSATAGLDSSDTRALFAAAFRNPARLYPDGERKAAH